MKKIISALLFPALLFSCKKSKDNTPAAPTADFWLSNVDIYVNEEFVLPTYFKFKTQNTSKNAVSYAWDFGNTQTSNQKDTVSFYTAAGNYTIALAVTGNNGEVANISKKVRVADRLLSDARYRSATWADATPVNAFIRIYKPAANNTVPALNGEAYASDVYYQSQTLSTTYFTRTLLQMALPEKTKLQPISTYMNATAPDSFVNYGYCFYAIEDGKEKLLLSSWDANTQLSYSESMESGQSRWTLTNDKGQLILFATNNQ
ncbi:PKD domain-containing protein [Filimonas lacunae]|uniref:PKD domain-containing protein n=1 Tax=Filimonas lacunae TaxID=477680 RepID=A0A173MIT8_9BACT|nr:PKD domain-containing protein [Filimonas lacunae]BAV07410.1 hypothetical protein FLA_3435 [Filimonas lacunae]SIT30469.1 PKD domain-containing protein [Filimonas lacunae]